MIGVFGRARKLSMVPEQLHILAALTPRTGGDTATGSVFANADGTESFLTDATALADYE